MVKFASSSPPAESAVWRFDSRREIDHFDCLIANSSFVATHTVLNCYFEGSMNYRKGV